MVWSGTSSGASDENGSADGMGWSDPSSDASGFGMGPSSDASCSWPLPSGEKGSGVGMGPSSDASCSWPLPWRSQLSLELHQALLWRFEAVAAVAAVEELEAVAAAGGIGAVAAAVEELESVDNSRFLAEASIKHRGGGSRGGLGPLPNLLNLSSSTICRHSM